MRIRLRTTWSSPGATDLYLDRFPAVMGRSPECNIPVELGFVSRHHCQFLLRNGQILVQDLESLNGTFVNNCLATFPTPIRSGDEIRLGPMGYRVTFVPLQDSRTQPSLAAPSEVTRF